MNSEKELKPPVSQAEFARIVCASRQAVTQAVKHGRLKRSVIKVNGSTLIEPVVGREEWESVDRSRTRGGEEVQRQRARLLATQADRAALELRARRGELLEIATAKAGWLDLVANFRARALMVPPVAVARLRIPAEDRPEAEEELERLIDECLRELSEGWRRPDDSL